MRCFDGSVTKNRASLRRIANHAKKKIKIKNKKLDLLQNRDPPHNTSKVGRVTPWAKVLHLELAWCMFNPHRVLSQAKSVNLLKRVTVILGLKLQ